MTSMPPNVSLLPSPTDLSPVTRKEGNRRLLLLADAVEYTASYSQYLFMRCGTPSCALGHWAAMNPGRWLFDRRGYQPRRCDAEEESWQTYGSGGVCDEFAVTEAEAHQLFGPLGCGGAGEDNHKAAAFIRAFVAARQ